MVSAIRCLCRFYTQEGHHQICDVGLQLASLGYEGLAGGRGYCPAVAVVQTETVSARKAITQLSSAQTLTQYPRHRRLCPNHPAAPTPEEASTACETHDMAQTPTLALPS